MSDTIAAEHHPQHADQYQALWETTVGCLTEAVQLSSDAGRALDLADFVASALATTAANVGDPSRLTSGRPESWESGLIDQLVAGEVGYAPAAQRVCLPVAV